MNEGKPKFPNDKAFNDRLKENGCIIHEAIRDILKETKKIREITIRGLGLFGGCKTISSVGWGGFPSSSPYDPLYTPPNIVSVDGGFQVGGTFYPQEAVIAIKYYE